jgi:hypothetical protein
MRKAKRIMNVRDFRANYRHLTEPVQVIRTRGDIRVLGTWYPAEDVADRTGVRYPADGSGTEDVDRAPERTG